MWLNMQTIYKWDFSSALCTFKLGPVLAMNKAKDDLRVHFIGAQPGATNIVTMLLSKHDVLQPIAGGRDPMPVPNFN